MSSDYLLEIEDLHTSIYTDDGVLRAVNGVNLRIPKGTIVGLVGESGCGKSMTARSIMRLLRHPARIDSGRILFGGKDLTTLTDKEMREISGRDISMIFQEPMTSLNPVLKVGFGGSEAQGDRDVRARRHPGGGEALQRLSPRAFRRSQAEGDDRYGDDSEA